MAMVPTSEESVQYLQLPGTRYKIYRWKLSGLAGDAQPEPIPFRFPGGDGEEYPFVTAVAAVGSRIFMIGGSYLSTSTDIYVVETKNLHTNDEGQIVRKIHNVLQARVRVRNAVAIDGKIYTFPTHFGHPRETPVAESRFDVFDPATETTKFLPEPPLQCSYRESVESFLVFKTHIIICLQQGGKLWMSAFDTANQESGWKDITLDYVAASLPIQHASGWQAITTGDTLDCSLNGRTQFPFFPTLSTRECATALGGGHDDGVFGTLLLDNYLYPAIVKFQEYPIAITNWCRILDVPGEALGRTCFSHGGHVFFTYTEDAQPESGIAVWEFKQFSLAYCYDPNHPMREYYAARPLSSFQLQCSSYHRLLASFVIPAEVS